MERRKRNRIPKVITVLALLPDRSGWPEALGMLVVSSCRTPAIDRLRLYGIDRSFRSVSRPRSLTGNPPATNGGTLLLRSISSPESSISSAVAIAIARSASPGTSGRALMSGSAMRVGFGPATSSISGGPLFAESYQRNNSHTSALPDMAAGRSVLRSRSRSVDSELKQRTPGQQQREILVHWTQSN
uniref:Uncharacterized protein n=1 Tax=Anopheles culicifacies TaxID=139723 RepID=A0A182MJL0_9DIPT